MKKRRTLAVLLMVLALIAAACGDEPVGQQSLVDEQNVSARIAERFADTQPVPEFEWSQQRQNLIELITAQARTTQTTTFFFHLGSDTPIGQCPSIGFPIPATYQLTNPLQGAKVETTAGGGDPAVAVGQLEATGVYTADTTGTFTICVDGNGNAYADYWEGFVKTVTGAAEWSDGQVVLIGDPTFDFSEGRGG